MPLRRQQLIARVRHREDHHPELEPGYDRCVGRGTGQPGYERCVGRGTAQPVYKDPINDLICVARSDTVQLGKLH